MQYRVLLASQSSSRLTLLRQAGIEPQVLVSHVDEDEIARANPNLSTGELCVLLATAKGQAVANSLAADHEPTLIIAADSMLEFAGNSYGKPATPDVAISRWQAMRGNTGRLQTGHWIYNTHTKATRTGLAGADVKFANISDDEIAAYVSSGEPLHVAGGFTHEGRSAAFIESIDGDGPAVAGLSLALLRKLCAEVDIQWISLWQDED
jgi:septum formation protein